MRGWIWRGTFAGVGWPCWRSVSARARVVGMLCPNVRDLGDGLRGKVDRSAEANLRVDYDCMCFVGDLRLYREGPCQETVPALDSVEPEQESVELQGDSQASEITGRETDVVTESSHSENSGSVQPGHCDFKSLVA